LTQIPFNPRNHQSTYRMTRFREPAMLHRLRCLPLRQRHLTHAINHRTHSMSHCIRSGSRSPASAAAQRFHPTIGAPHQCGEFIARQNVALYRARDLQTSTGSLPTMVAAFRSAIAAAELAMSLNTALICLNNFTPHCNNSFNSHKYSKNRVGFSPHPGKL